MDGYTHKTMRVLLIFILLSTSMQLHSQDFQQYRWENRLLIIVDQSDDQSNRQQQITYFQAAAEGLLDRKLKVFSFSQKGWQAGLQVSPNWKQTELPNSFSTDQLFALYLVGLDGGIKAIYDKPATPQSIFALIDTMPMRRVELRSRKSRS